MVEYRRENTKYEWSELLDKYKNLINAEGGVFRPDKRRKLLGLKPKADDPPHKDTANFWYDVRKTVKSGLKDLELICDIAHPDQLKEMFTETLSREENDEKTRLQNELEKSTNEKTRQIIFNKFNKFPKRIPSLEKLLTSLFKDYIKCQYAIDKKSGRKYSKA